MNPNTNQFEALREQFETTDAEATADVIQRKLDAVVEANVVQEHLLARLKQLRRHTESWLKNHGDRYGK